MSREIEAFKEKWGDEYPSVLRWVDLPPGKQCECGADMFLHESGVLWICSECPKQERYRKGAVV